MSKYEIVPVRDQHISYLASHMRDADMAEVAVSIGLPPKDAIEAAMKVSRQTATALADGEPMAIFGVVTATVMSRVATPWILTSKIVPHHRRAFMRLSKAILERWKEAYPAMSQFIDSRYPEAMRWAEWLGFTAVDTILVGDERIPFIKYELRT